MYLLSTLQQLLDEMTGDEATAPVTRETVSAMSGHFFAL
jgi:hypothetical protein